MKKLSVVACGLLALSTLVGACDVCDGSDVETGTVTLRTQADVDEMEGVLCVLEDLHIGADLGDNEPNDSIVDTSPLADLQIVEGDLEVAANLVLAELELEELIFVGRRLVERDGERLRAGLFIQNNLVLSKLDMPSLTDVGGCIDIHDNPRLDPGDVDDLFNDVKAHAFPGSCDGDIEQNVNNGFEL